MADPGAVPMYGQLAYFLTWTTYGTWLPGGKRGWVKEYKGFQLPNWKAEHEARRKLSEPPLILDDEQRALIESTIRRHCEIRGWLLLALACRTNRVHVVVSAPVSPETVMNQFSAWCTRRLKEQQQARGEAIRENW
jgi:hypothetical protein